MSKGKHSTKISTLVFFLLKKKRGGGGTDLHKQMHLVKKLFCKMHWKSNFIL